MHFALASPLHIPSTVSVLSFQEGLAMRMGGGKYVCFLLPFHYSNLGLILPFPVEISKAVSSIVRLLLHRFVQLVDPHPVHW